ncbi:carboxypeptidase-like regulatory domain-containing protein [Dokdonia ponticola]|uniref:Carboxypeptidase-like regulatory domain-containing protein n=1 Tax=Dokdonia ponticola TaxID=2041041 RepID=A0ABV9I3L9_9FLAO
MPSITPMIRSLVVLLGLFVTPLIYSQQDSFIEGRLIDEKEETPIPFATIRVKNKSKGLISNMDGGFKIPEKLQKLGDTLVISSIGYESQEIVLSNLNKEKINIIKLAAKVEALATVTIVGSKKKRKKNSKKKLTARAIIQTAIENIPDNYPFDPFSYVGYYRDYQIKEKEYVNLNEAIMGVSDPGFNYQDKKYTNIQLYTYKRNTNFRTDTIAARPYDYINNNKVIPNATLKGQGGNEYTILRLHDAIRNYNIDSYDFINRFDRDIIKNHRLKLLPETSIANTQLYVIKMVKSQENYRAEGTIYISQSDFKIYKMEYTVFDTSSSRKKAALPQGLAESIVMEKDKPKKLLYEIIVEYQLEDFKMYPNYISFNNAFDVLQPPKFKPTKAIADITKKRFELTFNNEPLRKDALRKNNYKLWYQNEKISLDSVSIRENKVLLYPKDPEIIFLKKIRESEESDKNTLFIQVKNIEDIDGNMINEQESTTYYQYREFFVQELRLQEKLFSNTGYMSKNRPIFLNQPIKAPENMSDYWMNTPLKN